MQQYIGCWLSWKALAGLEVITSAIEMMEVFAQFCRKKKPRQRHIHAALHEIGKNQRHGAF